MKRHVSEHASHSDHTKVGAHALHRIRHRAAVPTILVLAGLLSLSAASAGPQSVTLIRDVARGGWQCFGYGALDNGANPSRNEARIQADWGRATWGIGMRYQLAEPVDGRTVSSVRVDVRSQRGVGTRIHAAVATAFDATLELNRTNAVPVTESWQTVEFQVGDMHKTRPEKISPEFHAEDMARIQVVKFLLSKPDDGVLGTDTIYFRNPQLIFDDKTLASRDR